MRWASVLAVAASLASCGGGGGGLPLTLAFNPGTLHKQFYEHELPGPIGVQLTVTGSTKAQTIYVRVSDSAQTIDVTSLSVTAYDESHFGAGFATLGNLPPGTRTGTLTVRLCDSSDCSSLLGRGALPYTVVVQPNPPPVLNSLSPSPLSVAALIPNGAPTLTASMGGWIDTLPYAKLVDDAGTFDGSSALQMTPAGNNNFSVVLPYAPDVAEGRHTGTLTVTICDEPSCAKPIGTQSLPYTVQLFTLIGGSWSVEGSADGPAGQSLFYSPSDVVVDADYTVYIAATNNHALRKIDPDGNTSTVAAINGHAWGVALGPNDTVLVTDGFRCVIRSVAPDGTVTNIAGNYDSCSSYAVWSPQGIVADPAGGGYFVDSCCVVKKFLNGAITTFAGSAEQQGSSDGQGSAARFTSLQDITRDSAGNLFVTDRNNSTIRKITPDGTVTTFAGSTGARASVDGLGAAARFTGPDSIAIDAQDNLYVADVYDGSAVRKVTPASEVTTIARNIRGPDGRQLNVSWVGVSPDGTVLVVSDHGHDVIVRTRLETPGN